MVIATDAHYLGSKEPTPVFTQLATNAKEYIVAFSWYNYFYDPPKYKKYMITYMINSNLWDNDTIDIVKEAPDHYFLPVHYAIARMVNNGWYLPEKFLSNINSKIEKVIKKQLDNRQEALMAVKPVVVNPQLKSRANQSLLIAYFETQIDQFVSNGYTSIFNPYKYFNARQTQLQHAAAVANYYGRLLDELNNIENDPDLKYAYRNLTKKQIRDYIAFVTLIIDDSNRWSNNKKAINTTSTKPAVAKIVNTEKMVKYLNYLKEFPALKLMSINPESVVKATQLWTFNVKYNSITKYTSLEGGFTVEGTTLKNIDMNNSVCKTLRKPDQMLKELLNAGKVTLKSFVDNLTTKPYAVSGRINKDTILLRVSNG